MDAPVREVEVVAAALVEAEAPPAWERMQTYAQPSLSLLCRTEPLTGQRGAQLRLMLSWHNLPPPPREEGAHMVH